MASSPDYNAATLMRVAQKAGITNPTEVAMFAAQMRHESGNFQYDKEIGDNAYFAKYDGRSDLGNNQPGDGAKFCGRGFTQLTGRANYTHFGEKIGVDLVNHPEKAQEPEIAARIAVEYWKERVDSKAAQAGDVDTVTKQINGGHNGIEERRKYFAEYKSNPSLLAAASNAAPSTSQQTAPAVPPSNVATDLAQYGLKPDSKIADATITKPDGTKVKLSDVVQQLIPQLQAAGVDTSKVTSASATAAEFYAASQELRKKKELESTVASSGQPQQTDPMQDMMGSMGNNPLVMVLALFAMAMNDKEQPVASAPAPASLPTAVARPTPISGGDDISLAGPVPPPLAPPPSVTSAPSVPAQAQR